MRNQVGFLFGYRHQLHTGVEKKIGNARKLEQPSASGAKLAFGNQSVGPRIAVTDWVLQEMTLTVDQTEINAPSVYGQGQGENSIGDAIDTCSKAVQDFSVQS